MENLVYLMLVEISERNLKVDQLYKGIDKQVKLNYNFEKTIRSLLYP